MENQENQPHHKIINNKEKQPKSLRAKVFYSIFSVAILIEILSFGLLFIAFDRIIEKQTYESLKDETNKLKSQMNNTEYLNFWRDYPYRITLVASDGKVLYDNRLDFVNMSNHLEHEEIQEAFLHKSAQTKRFSESINQKSLYYAVFLPEYNAVLRVSTAQKSLYQTYFDLLPSVCLVLVITFIISILLAQWITRSIMSPINHFEFTDSKILPSKTPYMEFSSFIDKITTQQKKIKKQLKIIELQNKQFQAITQNINEGFVLLDAKGKILAFNQSSQNILPDLSIDRNIQDTQNLQEIFSNIDLNKTQIQAKEHEINTYYIETIALPIIGKNKPKAFIVLLLDKSQQFEIQNLRKEFSANVTHELKTPLSVIMASSEMIRNNLVLPSDIPSFMDKIYLESKRLLGIINDILKLSFFDEGATKPEKTKVDLTKIAQKVCNSLLLLAKQRNIQIHLIGTKCEIYGVPNLLEDMIYNLCENAIKYNKENGIVDIIISKDDDTATLCVKDSGIGIPRLEQERVFERFYRVDKSRSKKLGGTGLGLSIVKHIAQYHNATISLQSEINHGCEIKASFVIGEILKDRHNQV